MKRIITVNLIIVLLFTLCSCGLTVTQTENSPSKTNVPSTREKSETVTTETSSEIKKETTQTQTTENATELTSKKKTDPTSTKTSSTTRIKTTEAKKQLTCTVEISCKNILGNKDKLKENKTAFLPENGNILNATEIKVPEGSTVFDVLKKVCADNICTDQCTYCKKNGIHLDYVYTPGYDNYYIRGIHQIYEKDCGTQSGWMYSVNGVFPNYGCSEYKVREGDIIQFSYTCDLGEDLGAAEQSE